MEAMLASQLPLVSVVVATYRRCETLKKALSSLASQTYRPLEVIVVDDNADDVWSEKVSSVVEEIRERANLKITLIVNRHNCGSAATRNKGIREAEGQYITFLDDDDVYLPEKAEMQLKDMISAKADFGITDLLLYNAQDQVADKRVRSYIEKTDTNALMRYHLLHHMTGTDTLMFRSDYLRKIGGFPGIDVGDEFYLMKEAILGGGRFVYSNHCFVKAYIHIGEDEALSSGQGKINGENALYEEKKKHFSQLTKADIRRVKTRHHAVIAFAQLRRRAWIPFFASATSAFLCSPIECIRLLKEHK